MELLERVDLLLEDRYVDVDLVYDNNEFALVLADGNISTYQDEPSMLQILETIDAAFDGMSSQQIIQYVKDVGRAKMAVRAKNLYKVVSIFP
jgi:hypothetical protein